MRPSVWHSWLGKLRNPRKPIRAEPDSAHIEILALGTSNCVGPDSFVAKMSDLFGLPVRNLSMGASSSTLGLYLLDQISRVARGIAFIDYSVNDVHASWNLWGTANAPGIIESNIRSIASTLSAKNYLPVVLLLPLDLDKQPDAFGERLYCETCIQAGINFVNLRQLFRSVFADGVGMGALMRDNAHMSDRAAELVARFFAEIIERARSGAWSRGMDSTSIFRSRIIEAPQLFPAGAIVTRESSQRSALYGRLGLGEMIRIPIGSRERLAGILINTGAKGGMVTIRGSNIEVTKSLTVYWDDDHPDWYIAMLVDVAGSIHGGPSGVTMELVAGDRVPTEPTLHARPALPNRYGEVEIEGVVVAELDDATIEFSKQTCAQLPLDLGATKEAEKLRKDLMKLQ